MNEVQFLFASKPCKPLKPRFLDVVFLVEKDVRAYTLAYRNGIMEAVGALPITEKDTSIISLVRVEQYVLSSWGPFWSSSSDI